MRAIVIAALLAGAGVTPALADVVISSDATQNMSCSGGVCAPTATDAVLNVTDLENMLASGSLEVTTTGSGVEANKMVIQAPLTWSAANGLTLDAKRSLHVYRPISVGGTAALALAMQGRLRFTWPGSITFASLSSTLTINGLNYQLEDSIASLASAIVTDPHGAFALANSYDASADGTYSSSPIQTTFTGALEGLGNRISHLSINDTGDYTVGLFSYVSRGTVADVRLIRVHIEASHRGLIGGLAGQMSGTLVGDVVSGSVESTNQSSVGGLVGAADGGNVVDSHSSARVIGRGGGAAGSLVGQNGTITDSYATGDATGTGGGCIGGLAGTGETIKNSFATGTARGASSSSTSLSVGGLAGCANGTISNSYATGEARTAHSAKTIPYVGGLVGYMVGTISYSYSTGFVHGSGHVGGLCGYVQQNGSEDFTDTYWDTDTSGVTNLGQGCGNTDWPGITGLTTGELQSGLPSGFDPAIWAEEASINNGFPYLVANPPAK